MPKKTKKKRARKLDSELKVRKKLIATPRVTKFEDYRASEGLIRVLWRANNTLFPELMLSVKLRGLAHKAQDDMLKASGFTEEKNGQWVFRSNKFSVFLYV